MTARKRFRSRGPCRIIENMAVIPGNEVDTWLEVLDWLRAVTPERLDSFRIQINYRKGATKREKGKDR